MEKENTSFLDKVAFIDTKLDEVLKSAFKTEKKYKTRLRNIESQYSASAINLMDYLAFRSFDIDKLQKKMQKLGFSDLSDISSHVRQTLISVKGIADMVLGKKPKYEDEEYITARKSQKLLEANCDALFGTKPEKRGTRIMVTMPAQAAEDIKLIESMLDAGMDCARINCAHDTPEIWNTIIKNIHTAKKSMEKECSIVMDIAGPKIRTGSLAGDPITVKEGDTLVLTRELVPGEGRKEDKSAHIGCTLENVFQCAKPGNRIYYDDGKVEGNIEKVSPDEIEVRITNAKSSGSKIKGDKGLNFPDTKLNCQGFTPKDKEHLAIIAKNQKKWKINALNLSFVNNPAELDTMIRDIKKLGVKTGIIIKIETEQAFEHLPGIILSAMQIYPAGIMLARGDLAIETGWKNFATIQEEIIRITSAAHLPLVWATQVLETLAKDGVPTRAEITDAALSERSSCVMLNKGNYIVMAIRMLDKIVRRMEKFRTKSENVLPKLDGAEKLMLSHRKYDI